jgi:hypothetical protein
MTGTMVLVCVLLIVVLVLMAAALVKYLRSGSPPGPQSS